MHYQKQAALSYILHRSHWLMVTFVKGSYLDNMRIVSIMESSEQSLMDILNIKNFCDLFSQKGVKGVTNRVSLYLSS